MASTALKVGELAKRSGLTVRALHHYDQIGLLKPSYHTGSGHRLYTAADLGRLQQIVSLRQLGFTLEEIGRCLTGATTSPREIVHLHLARLQEQMEQLGCLRQRLETIAAHLDAAEEVSADEFLQTIEAIIMLEKLYTPEQLQQFAAVGKAVGQDEIRAIEEGWTTLLAEIRANPHLDPASPEAQALGQRYENLTARTIKGYEGFPELKQAIHDNYKQGNFEGHAGAPQASDMAFIESVKAARPQ